ncbi:MAG: CotH kinase family protein [Arcicella sp.]|nr:CotH kinase family protein [Arcicella sp.]
MKKILLLLILILNASLLNIYGQNVNFSESVLPIIKVNTKGKTIVNEPKIVADLEIIDNGIGKTNKISDKANVYLGKTGIEFRGSTSQTFFPKKPYGFELWVDSTEVSRKVALLGMPSESDWVLNTSYNDKTFMRDVLAYDLANRMGRYATRTRYCEMVVNGNYEGIYILMEKVKRDKNRVDVSSLKTTDNTGDDVTGGYILKIDKTEGSKSRLWNTQLNVNGRNYTIPIQIEYPKITDITDAQFNYIKNYITEFETSLSSPDFLNPNAKWRSMSDMDSFVDYLILTEVSKNVDGYRLSTYFSKDKDSKGGKLKMGPAWDYNLAFGNADYANGYITSGFQYNANDVLIPANDIAFLTPIWWQRLATDTTFQSKIGKRWRVLKQSVLSPDRIDKWMDSTATVLQPITVRNFNRWQGVLGKKVWPNYYVGVTYNDEVNWMKNWIRQRISWLDSQFSSYGLLLASEQDAPKQSPLRIFPNPTENQSMIEYDVLRKARVSIQVYDLTGRLIKTLVDDDKSAQTYKIPFNGGNLQSGVYIVDYQANGVLVERVKMVKR